MLSWGVGVGKDGTDNRTERKVKPGGENWQVYTSLEVNPPLSTSLCTAPLTVPGQQNQGMS